MRPLKVFAFDPSLGRRYGNLMTVAVPHEPLAPGPIGARVEVIDYDATNRCYYRAVDLDAPDVLIQGGLPPSESDPRFHQQMAYAVVTQTLGHFGQALGREMAWSGRRRDRGESRPRPLRVLPHAKQDANAYYDPAAHALYFGYFGAGNGPTGASPTVFTCLSYDVIAHETTHALVHDIRRHFMDVTGPDTLAFHEAFADIVALLQHFTFREALVEHVRGTGGALHRQSLRALVAPAVGQPAAPGAPATLAEAEQRNVLVDLAMQLGKALGPRAALRSALDSPPDPAEYARRFEPHERGAILVAAVFDAFFTIYSTRMADLMRIAGPGARTAEGGLGLDLAQRLAGEAAKTARHFLHMCIRALDYCPPVDISFGDFLRALLTVDCDLVPDDDRGYRDILIEAFGRRGLLPTDVSSHSEGALVWQPAETRGGRPLRCLGLSFDVIQGSSAGLQSRNAEILNAFGRAHARELRLSPRHRIQPWSFHPVHRVGPDGQLDFQVVVELLQQEEVPIWPGERGRRAVFRGGCTLVLDARSGEVRHCVYKRLASRHRRKGQQDFWSDWLAARNPPFLKPGAPRLRADFALVHRGP